MANEQNIANFLDHLPNAFPVDTEAAWKTWTAFNQQFAGIALTAASKSNEIATTGLQETFSRLHDVTKAREEPREYVQVFTDFAQAQLELTRRTAEAYGTVLRESQAEATELLTTAGKQIIETGAENAKTVDKKPVGRSRKAA